VKALLDAGADMEFKNEEEKSAIHLAAEAGKTK
jgi:ankyrin repeat protein